VLIHSHIASAGEAAVKRLREEAAELVSLAAQGKPLRNVVNGASPMPLSAGLPS
jgi:hypothetical protein